MNETQVNRKIEIIKIRTELNKIEKEKTIKN